MQIGELSGGLSEEFRKETASQIQWGPMRAMRNYFAHAYAKMDRQVIWETATIDIPALADFCESYLYYAQTYDPDQTAAGHEMSQDDSWEPEM